MVADTKSTLRAREQCGARDGRRIGLAIGPSSSSGSGPFSRAHIPAVVFCLWLIGARWSFSVHVALGVVEVVGPGVACEVVVQVGRQVGDEGASQADALARVERRHFPQQIIVRSIFVCISL